MQVVADEFKHQGYVMKGPCSSLASGKAKNVARDMQRGFNRKQLDPATWEPLLKVFPLWFHPKAISWKTIYTVAIKHVMPFGPWTIDNKTIKTGS